MLRISRLYIFLLITPLLFVSCSKSGDENSVKWGKVNCYDNFLWKKYVPDTLYRDLVFDFNSDAKMFMGRPLKMGLFKKNDIGKMVLVKEDEMSLYVDGKRCADNLVEVDPGCENLRVGIVFAKEAEEKVHHWFFKPVDDGGLERINELTPAEFNADNSSLLGVDVEKNEIINPLRLIVRIIWITLVVLLFVWFLFLKRMFFPYFGVGRMVLSDPEPYLKTINFRKYRKFILTNKQIKQSWLNSVFTGTVGYDINTLWDSDIVFEPKNRKSVRVSTNNDVFFIDGRTLTVGNVYTIENLNTKAKTKIEL